MAEVIVQRSSNKCDVYCYDTITNAIEVAVTLNGIVKKFGMKKNIWVISGTHGDVSGTVMPADRHTIFKTEDLVKAGITSKNIHVMDYHLLAGNRWKEICVKPAATNVIVLAFCYSSQWLGNPSPNGNNGKL